MLHILLLILKIIGIIFAVILGILVLMVCVILFVPVRYRMEVSCDGSLKETRATAKVTWLLRLIRLHISYENKELSWRIRVAWKSIQSGQEEKKTIKAEVETYDKEVEELWKDFKDDLEEKTGEEHEEKPKKDSGNVAKKTGERPVEIPEKRQDRLVEGHEEELEDAWKEQRKAGGEAEETVEKDPQEPEELLAKLEQEMERVLEGETILEEAETDDPGVRRNAHKECCEEAGSEEREELLRQSGEEREEESEADSEEREEDLGQSSEERKEDSKTSSEEREELSEDSSQEWREREEDHDDSSEERQEDDGGSEEERKHIWQKITGICQKIIEKVTSLYRKIVDIPGKIQCTIENICGKIKILSEKKDKILEFLTDEIHKKAFLKIKDEGVWLLRKLKPRKIAGKIHYGFEDPCLTGKVLAGFSVVYPFTGDNVEIYPDFEGRIFKGHFEAAGGVRVIFFVKLLWKLVWCKEVRMTYRHVRQFKL